MMCVCFDLFGNNDSMRAIDASLCSNPKGAWLVRGVRVSARVLSLGRLVLTQF